MNRNSLRIDLAPHDKPGGRPDCSFTAAELGLLLAPKVREGDFLIRMEENASETFREGDLLLVRHDPDVVPVPGMVLVMLRNDSMWPEPVIGSDARGPVLETPAAAGSPESWYRTERIGYVIWSARDWPSP